MFTNLKQKFVNWLLKDVHIQEAMFGKNSVKLTDLIKFTTTASPTTAGELGMDTATGRPQAYIGGVVKNLAHTDETGGDIATQANMEAQTASKIVDASVFKYHPAAAKAWVLVTYSGGVPAATVSNNVTSITDVGTGDLTVNFTTPFSTASYASCLTARRAAGDSALFAAVKFSVAPTASALAIQTLTVGPALEDAGQVSVICFGDL